MPKLIYDLVKDFDESCYIMATSHGFVIKFDSFWEATQLIKLLMQIFEIDLIISKKINGKSKDVLITEIPEYFETDLRKMRQKIHSPMIIIIKNNLIMINKEGEVAYISQKTFNIKDNIKLFYDYLYTEESTNNKIIKIIKES